MNTTRAFSPDPSLPLTVMRQIDAACEAFEAAWQADTHSRPDLAAFAERVPESARPPLLHELIRLECYYRRKAGETPTADEYRGRFPHLDPANVAAAADADTVTDLRPRAETAVAPDRLVSGHELLGKLGVGGMGIVYKARHVGFNRIVALKTIRKGDFASAIELQRFRVEAEAVARLQHPNIVAIYEVGECIPPGSATPGPYFSLEYAPGGTLAAKYDRTPQPARDAAATVEALARGVHHAHEMGVVHRDLKPVNVLLGADGTPKVTDFGLAKLLDTEDLTRTGAIFGTPPYMAPEQAEGRTKEVGPTTDVYALGCILYEALTGNPPFRGENDASTLEMVRTQEPVPPRRLLPTVPRDLEVIALKCLEKESRKRYATAADLADDLRRFTDGRPIQARPVGRGERAWRWCRRNPPLAVAGGLAITALLAVAIVSVVFTISQARANRDLRAEQEKVELALRDSKAQQLLGAEMAYGQGLRLCEQKDATRGLLWLGRAYELAPADATDLHARIRRAIGEWAQSHPRVRAILDHPVPVRDVVYHPSGKTLVTIAGRVAQIWDCGDRSPNLGKPIGKPMQHREGIDRAEFSPDGRRLLTATNMGHLRVWRSDADAGDATGTPLSEEVVQAATGIADIGWSQDNETFVVAGEFVPPFLTFWKVEPGDGVRPLTKLKSHSFDGGQQMYPFASRMEHGPLFLVQMAYEAAVGYRCFSLKTHDAVGPEFIPKGEDGSWAALSPQGRYLAVSAEEHVDVYQLNTEEDPVVKLRIRLAQAKTSRGTFRGGDGSLAVLGTNGLLRVWNLNPDNDPDFGKELTDAVPVGNQIVHLDGAGLETIAVQDGRAEYTAWDASVQVGQRRPSKVEIPYGLGWRSTAKFHSIQTYRRVFAGRGQAMVWQGGREGRGVVGHAIPSADRSQLSAAVAPDDSTIAIWSDRESPRVCLWSPILDDNAVTITLGVGNFDVRHDGRYLATLRSEPKEVGQPELQHTVRLHDGETGKELFEWPVGSGGGLGFSADGQRLLVGSGGPSCELWGVAGLPTVAPRLLHKIELGEPGVYRIGTNARTHFSPDGRKLLLNAAGPDDVSRQFLVNVDPKSPGFGSKIELPHRQGGTPAITRPFRSDSRMFLTGHHEDGGVWTADAETGKLIGRLDWPEGKNGEVSEIGFAAAHPSILAVATLRGDSLGQQVMFRQWDSDTRAVTQTVDSGNGDRSIGGYADGRPINTVLLDQAFNRGRFEAKEVTTLMAAAIRAADVFDRGVSEYPSRSLLHASHGLYLAEHPNLGNQLIDATTLRHVGLPLDFGTYRFTTGRWYWHHEDFVGQGRLRRFSLAEPVTGTPAEVRNWLHKLTGLRLGERGELIPLTAVEW